MNVYEMIAFVGYLVVVLGVGVYFFLKQRSIDEKSYFLGDKNMNGWVSALSAGASDMSAWVLMGLPGSIFLYGLGQVWISIGLWIGTIGAWVFVAPRLRRYAIVAQDSITLPQFLSNRFRTEKPTLRVASAVIFLVGYCLYGASSIFACGQLFHMLIPTVSQTAAMIVAAIVILAYTLLGGFNAVCWTDFFQGMLMLGALMIVPCVALGVLNTSGSLGTVSTPDNYYNLLAGGEWNWKSISTILTGLGWGLGYAGMPHILVRYMAIKSEKEMKKSQIIGSCWTGLILLMATAVALVAHEFLGDTLAEADRNLVFVKVVRSIFSDGGWAILGGILISAIVAASMSTADSQLLAASSAFSSDIYKTLSKKKVSDQKMLSVGRWAVVAVSLAAFALALLVHLLQIGGVMELVSAAWSIFGAAFGPTVLLALYWKRFTVQGACAAILSGFGVSVLWMVLFHLESYGFRSLIADSGLYEIVPGFFFSLLTGWLVSKKTQPNEEAMQVFDRAMTYRD